LVHRMAFTWPRPCLFRPWFLLFEVIFSATKENLMD
jgi:hypothetical protein